MVLVATHVVGGVNEVDKVRSDVVGKLGEERLGLLLSQRAHLNRTGEVSSCRRGQDLSWVGQDKLLERVGR